MSKMVERVAQAIFAVRTTNINYYEAETMAKAAIAAMRESTAAMIEAGQKPPRAPFRYVAGASLRLRWLAMIDAALADETLTAPTHPKTATGD